MPLGKFGQIFKILIKKKTGKNNTPPPQATTPHSDQKIADEAPGTLINGRYKHIPLAIRPSDHLVNPGHLLDREAHNEMLDKDTFSPSKSFVSVVN